MTNPVIGPQDRAPWRWVTIASGPRIAIDASLGFHFRVALTENATLEPPLNGERGQRILIRFEQDGTGRTVTTHADIVGTAVVSTTANAISYVEMVYDDVADAWGVVPSGLTQTQTDALYQPLDASLTSIASLGTAADKMLYTTAADTWAESAVTSHGRTIVAGVNAGATRSTLGLGSAYAANVAAADADSTAAVLADLVTDHNDLLAKLRAAGLMAT